MKTNKRSRKKHNAEPRVIGRLTAAVIVAALSVNGYYAYTMFGGDIAAAAIYKGMSDEQIALQQEREALKQQEEDSGYIFFTPAASGGDLNMVIVGESDAEAVFGELRYELDLIDMSDTFPLAYSRSNEYFDVYTLQQYHDGIEVYGHEIKLTADKSGNLLSVGGSHAALKDFDTSVSLSEDDACAYAEKYLKSEYQLSLEDVSIERLGKKIGFDENDEPVMGYLFEVRVFSETAFLERRIAVDANKKTIIFDNSCFSTEMVTLKQNDDSIYQKLQGQLELQTLDVWRESETEFVTKDVDRNIDAHRLLLAVDVDFYNFDVFDQMLTELITWNPKNETIYPEIVDAMSNVQKVYDFYDDVFHRKGVHNSEDSHLSIWFDVPGYTGNAAMTDSGNFIYIGSGENENDIILSAYLDIMGHEYTHGVINNDSSIRIGNYDTPESAIHEGIADVFGELIEDYCKDGYDNSCNWITGAAGEGRNIKIPSEPSDESEVGYLTNADDYYKEDGSTIEGHVASTLVSHPAYLMTQGVNGTEALSTEQLGKLYYNSISQLYAGIKFKGFREKIEDTALYMNQNKAVNSEKGQLTDSQWESVIDSFDRVGIERIYDHSLVKDAEIEVIDINNKPYDNYHLMITRKNDGKVVVDQDVKKKKYTLPDLAKGVYEFELTDLANKDNSETVSVIINDNVAGQLTEEYKTNDHILTNFGSPNKEVALVLDVSGSMEGTPMAQTKQAALNFVDTVFEANPNICVSLITYSDSAHLLLESCNNEALLCGTIMGLYANGGTEMVNAISTAESILNQKTVDDKYVIVMSDGMPADSPGLAANSIKENDIILCSLGFYHSSSEGAGLMQSIASPGYYYNVQNAADIQGVFDEIARQVSGDEYSIRRIACPVDVIVSCNGETLCSAEENQNLRTSFGSITFEGEEGEIKVLRLDEKADYEICIYGTGTGTMDYTVSYVDENGVYTDVRSFEDVPIKEKTVISTRSAEPARTLLEVDTDGDGKFDLKYSGRSGEQGKETIDSLLIFAVILPAVILVLWLVLEIVLLIRRIRKNHICSGCGSRIAGSTSFCGKCGGQIIRTPVMPGWKRLSRGKKGLRIFQLSVTAVCLMLTLMTTFVYRSAANTVYLQLKNSERVSAEMLYQNSVQDTKLPKLYLSAVTELYLDKVQKELLSEKLDDTEASAIYQTVADMEMGDASDTAKDALKKLSAEEYAEDKQIMN